MIVYPGFEFPVAGAGNIVALDGVVWTGTASIAGNGSVINGGQAAPEGVQALFLYHNASASQSFTTTPGTYCLVAKIAKAAGGSETPDIRFDVDGVTIGQWVVDSLTYTDYTTFQFTVTGTHTLTISGLASKPGRDPQLLVDDLRLISAVGVNCAVPDGGFESPILFSDTESTADAAALSITPWTFAGLSGIAPNNSAISVPGIGEDGTPLLAPEGVQAGWLQWTTGTIGQDLVVASGLYRLTFKARQRANFAGLQPHPQDFDVKFDGTTYARLRPTSDHWPSFYTTIDNIEVTAGTRTLQFAGVNTVGGGASAYGPGEVALIDDVHFELVSLPTGLPGVVGRLGNTEIRAGSSGVTVNLKWAFGVNAGSPTVFTLTPSVGTVDDTTLTLAATSGATATTTLRIPSGTLVPSGTITITNGAGLPTFVINFSVLVPLVDMTDVRIGPDRRVMSVHPVSHADGTALVCQEVNSGPAAILTVNGVSRTLPPPLCSGVDNAVLFRLVPNPYSVYVTDQVTASTTGTWHTPGPAIDLSQCVGGHYQYSDGAGDTITGTIASPLDGTYNLHATIPNDLVNFGTNTRTTDALYTVKADGVTIATFHVNQHAIDVRATNTATRVASHHFSEANALYTLVGPITVPASTTNLTITVSNAAGSGRLVYGSIALESNFGPAFAADAVVSVHFQDGYINTPIDTTSDTVVTPQFYTDDQWYAHDPSFDRSVMSVGYNLGGIASAYPEHMLADMTLCAETWRASVGTVTLDDKDQPIGVSANGVYSSQITAQVNKNGVDESGTPVYPWEGDITVKFTSMGNPIVRVIDTGFGLHVSDDYSTNYTPGPGVHTWTFTPFWLFPQWMSANLSLALEVTSQGSTDDYIRDVSFFTPGTDPATAPTDLHPVIKERLVGHGFSYIRMINPQNNVSMSIASFEDIAPDGSWGQQYERTKTCSIASIAPVDLAGNSDGNLYYWPTVDLNGRAAMKVTVNPPGGLVAAAATAHLTGSVLTSITIDSGGSGYPWTPAVTLSGGGGLRARAEVDGMSGGVITSIRVCDGGVGYTSAPTVHIAQHPFHPGVRIALRADETGPFADTITNGSGGTGVIFNFPGGSYPVDELHFLVQLTTSSSAIGQTIPTTLDHAVTLTNGVAHVDVMTTLPMDRLLQFFNAGDFDAWILMFPLGTDDFFRRFARYWAQHSRVGIKTIVEYYNEPFNVGSQFPGASLLREMAAYDAATGGDATDYLKWYAKRYGEMRAIWKDEWVIQGRDLADLKFVLGGFFAVNGITEEEMDYCVSHGTRPDFVAVAPYDPNETWRTHYNGDDKNAFYVPLDARALVEMRGYHTAHTGLREILQGTLASVAAKFPDSATRPKLIGYEGGVGNMTLGYGGDRLLAMNYIAHRDPKMFLAERQYLEECARGGLAHHQQFVLSGIGFDYNVWRDYSCDMQGTMVAFDPTANANPYNLISGLVSPTGGARRYWATPLSIVSPRRRRISGAWLGQ